MEFLSNGFLVASSPEMINNIVYYGVDTEPWPLGTSLQLSPEWFQLKEVCFHDLSSVFLLCFEDAVNYYKACLKQIDGVRLLYCEASAQNVQYCSALHQQYGKPSSFLGYDYAYPSGSYYSAIVNDIIYRATPLSKNWKAQLNQYGLFSTQEALCGFIHDRSFLVSNDTIPYSYERGNFIVFRIFSVNDLFLS